MNYQQHPLSAAFPAMSDAEYTQLLDSITDIGVQNPITLHEGMVLDGWNRYRACEELGYVCPERIYDGEDPVRFVRAQNKHRRHLSLGAWALIEVALSAWRPSGRPEKGELSSPFQTTNEQMAANVGVTVRTIQHAKVVNASGAPEVKAAVETGSVSVREAAAISKLPIAEQVQALQAPKPARFQGKSKKVPATKWLAAEIKAAESKEHAERADAQVEPLQQEVTALRESLTIAHDDIASMAKVLDAGDQLAAALAEAKSSRDLARGLQQRINSMMTEIADLKRSVKYWEKKAGQPA
jgi:ParB-like chromosome segregation protein Spo0J